MNVPSFLDRTDEKEIIHKHHNFMQTVLSRRRKNEESFE